MKKLICKIFGHKRGKLIPAYPEQIAFITPCKRCGRELLSAKGMVKDQPDYITTIEY